MSDVAFPELSIFEKIFKSIIWDNGELAGEAALFGAVPWLAVWPLKPVIHYLLTHYGDQLYAFFVKVIDVRAIRFVDAVKQATYVSESIRLYQVGQTSGIGSPAFAQEREKAKHDFADWVHFGAVARVAA